jgi:putative redox protein
MAEITAELLGGTRVGLSNGRHHWEGDEPESNGGTDTAPTPYEMLLGALAHCTLVTLVLYARHKGIELGPVSAKYTHEKVPGPEGQTGLVDLLTSQVTIGGEYDQAVRKRLEQIVGRCRVHKTLELGARVVDEVEFTGRQ